MKIDSLGKEIRRLANAQNLTVEHETVQLLTGEKLRFWWLRDRLGRAPVGFPGGLPDSKTLNYLKKGVGDERASN